MRVKDLRVPFEQFSMNMSVHRTREVSVDPEGPPIFPLKQRYEQIRSSASVEAEPSVDAQTWDVPPVKEDEKGAEASATDADPSNG